MKAKEELKRLLSIKDHNGNLLHLEGELYVTPLLLNIPNDDC